MFNQNKNLTRAPPGVNIPPLRDIRHSSETALDIDMKLLVPYGTIILRLPWKFCANRKKNLWENDVLVTSCHAILGHKWTKIRSVVDCSILKQIANKNRQIEGNQILYKMAILVFRNFGFLPQKNPKTNCLEKNISKPELFEIFKKNGIYVGDLHVLSLHGKFQVIPFIFDHQMAPLSVQCHDVKILNHNFWRFWTSYTKINYTFGILRQTCTRFMCF